MKTEIDAPAKINLFLDVTEKRIDGFHNIVSIMQTISLCDKVSIYVEDYAENVIEVSGSSESMPLNEKNIAWSAAKKYVDRLDITNKKIVIYIKKRIPMCAGLAGGSTDAAAVLIGLDHIFGNIADTDTLLDIASQLGADVPFCVAKGTKLTMGKGEIMTDITCRPDYRILICASGESVSTAWAYSELDRVYNNFIGTRTETFSADELRNGLQSDNIELITSNMYNIFEGAVLQFCPLAAKYKKALDDSGALRSMMSGSGSAVYGIFRNEAQALAAQKELERNNIYSILCKPQ